MELKYPQYLWWSFRNDPPKDLPNGDRSYLHNGEYVPLTPEWIVYISNFLPLTLQRFSPEMIDFSQEYTYEEGEAPLLIYSFFSNLVQKPPKSYLVAPCTSYFIRSAEFLLGTALASESGTLYSKEFERLSNSNLEYALPGANLDSTTGQLVDNKFDGILFTR
jgi:hypothetical protein